MIWYVQRYSFCDLSITELANIDVSFKHCPAVINIMETAS